MATKKQNFAYQESLSEVLEAKLQAGVGDLVLTSKVCSSCAGPRPPRRNSKVKKRTKAKSGYTRTLSAQSNSTSQSGEVVCKMFFLHGVGSSALSLSEDSTSLWVDGLMLGCSCCVHFLQVMETQAILHPNVRTSSGFRSTTSIRNATFVDRVWHSTRWLGSSERLPSKREGCCLMFVLACLHCCAVAALNEGWWNVFFSCHQFRRKDRSNHPELQLQREFLFRPWEVSQSKFASQL